jgi:outer membrane protein assembly factor BamD (BamD/ComL family)
MACLLAAFGLTLLQGQNYEFAPDNKTPAGLILDEAYLLQDDQQRAVLLRQFVERYPGHQGMAWAYNELRQIARKSGDAREVLRISEHMLQLDPNDLYSGQMLLQTAEDLQAHAVRDRWLGTISRKAAEAGNKALVRYCDYLSLNSIMAGSAGARSRLEKLEEFLAGHPESAYRLQALVQRLYTYWEAFDFERGLGAAKDVLAVNPNDEDAMIFSAFALLERPEQAFGAEVYAKRLIEMLPGRKSPDQNNLVAWEKKKRVYIASAHWIIGMLASRDNNHALAEVSFQTALEGFPHDQKATAALLYFSGYSLLQTGDRARAIELFERCSKLEGPYQSKSLVQLQALRTARAAAADVEPERRVAEEQLIRSAAAACIRPRSARRL